MEILYTFSMGAGIPIWNTLLCKMMLHHTTNTAIITFENTGISCESIDRETGGNPVRSRHCNSEPPDVLSCH